ncbi:MAG: thermonuclease family protein [Nanoarchaeota archaeon]|nr:thermonuclease family protein [Nanoarchaeota archaeon]
MKERNIKNLFFATVVTLIIMGAIFLINDYNLTGYPTNMGEIRLVTKVIDGDTVIIEGGDSVRLLGIDTDEKGYPCYSQAKKRLEELVLNKEVYLEADEEDQDMYGRYLRYIILDGENINIKLVQEGLAVARSSQENKKYKKVMIDAERWAIDNKIGCKWGN